MPRPDLEFGEARDDRYWRLRLPVVGKGSPGQKERFIQDLQQIGYKLRVNLTAQSLSNLWLHHSLGHVCYDNCSDAEVKKFAVDRRLAPAHTTLTRAPLIRKLVKQDMDPTFDRFMDLPPEIRTIIYGMSMSDFAKETLWNPCQPPISRDCQLVRSETLPIFYSTCTFHFELDLDSKGGATNGDAFSGESSRYFHTLTDENIGDLRKLSIYVPHQLQTSTPYWQSSISFTITMGSSGKTFKVETGTPNRHFAAAILEEMKDGVASVMGDVVGRAGKSKLKREDFSRILAAVPRIKYA